MSEETFGTLLRTTRETRKAASNGVESREWLARTSGVCSASAIQGWENERDDPPSPTIVVELAKVLRIPPVTLLRASIRQRGKVELLVQFNQVGTAALLADAWPHLDENGLAMIRDVIATVKKGKAHG